MQEFYRYLSHPSSRFPRCSVYDGSNDLLEHQETFKAHMTLHGFLGEIACEAFSLTLKGAARAWFGSLSPETIDSFDDLAFLFITQIMASQKRRRPTTYLFTVKQRDGESLKLYLSRFNRERMTTDNQDEKITLIALLGGIWPRNPFMPEIARKTPTKLRESMDWADRFINAEDTLEALMASQWFEMVQVDWKVVGQNGGHNCGGEKEEHQIQKEREKHRPGHVGCPTLTSLAVKGDVNRAHEESQPETERATNIASTT
ncbi:uncharacterized protein LOC121245565 [Juglans microcarpa x Juglans regia]|uniref:uncharacterized protein LOC121245565 n=1 Tax=Juglans microcarpa x Juglans regia TaxID=2249226 RepID=UPI001B7EF4C5|nr:uncharacterized protein LOC121245565 [Juglans microcarpa x Juglans regia]